MPIEQSELRVKSSSLDRRYTNSTEVLASSSASSTAKPEDKEGAAPDNVTQRQDASAAVAAAAARPTAAAAEDPADSRRRRSSGGGSSGSARHRLVQRSRTVEDRGRTCCGRMAVAARAERRRASLDTTRGSHSSNVRRRCQRCCDKGQHLSSRLLTIFLINLITYFNNI